MLDPPDHRRLRALVNKAFTLRAVNALEACIRAVPVSLLDALDDPGGVDLMAAVAQPLPMIVVAEILGVPGELVLSMVGKFEREALRFRSAESGVRNRSRAERDRMAPVDRTTDPGRVCHRQRSHRSDSIG